MRHIVALLFLFATAAFADPIVIRAQRVIDGRGHVLRNAAIVMDRGKIIAVEPHPKKADIDLSNATLMPGGIDTHVHIGWHFDADGRSHSGDETDRKETPEESVLYAAENAYATLMTASPPCNPWARRWTPLRDAIERGFSRSTHLTAIEPLSDEKLTPTRCGHRWTRRRMKVRTDQGLRISEHPHGGGPTMSQSRWTPSAARPGGGLRVAVHAHGVESVAARSAPDAAPSSTERSSISRR
jgi:hypothetical protein